MTWKYILGWVGLLIVAMINGGLRDALYKSAVGELSAHQISTLTGIILFGLVIWWMTRLWPIESSQQAWIIGCLWLVMTVAFEFLFFHYVTGHSWVSYSATTTLLKGECGSLSASGHLSHHICSSDCSQKVSGDR
jgi:hypothetical protein